MQYEPEKVPIYSIINHLKIMFKYESLFIFIHSIKHTRCNNPPIIDVTPPNEGCLSVANKQVGWWPITT